MNPFLLARIRYIWENLSFVFPVWLVFCLLCGLVVFFILKAKKKGIFHLIGVNFFIFLILVATLIFSGELYFRFIFDKSGSLGNLQTSKRWLTRHVTYNADFFRDRNFEPKKPGVTRIGVVGDSVAFGWGIPQVADRFSDRLEKKLNQSFPGKYEVYNASIPGSESKDELQFLKDRAGMFEFDTIILAYFLNDIYKDRQINLDFIDQKYEKVFRNPSLRPIFDKSFFLEFAAGVFINYFNGSTDDLAKREINLYQDPASWAEHQKTLSQIVALTQKNKQRLIVVIFPFMSSVSQNPYPAAFVHENLKKFFKEKEIEVLDLSSYLKKYPRDLLKANPFDYHPSAMVHKITADLLFQQIQKGK